MEQTQRDPEKYPEVTIDGQTYPLKLTLEQLDQMEDETGIDLGNLGQAGLKGKENRKKVLTLLSYALRPAGVNLTPEELNKKLELRHFGKVAEAMTELMGGKKTTVETPQPKASEVIQ